MNFASVRIITDNLDEVVAFYELVTETAATRPAPVFAEFRSPTGTLAIASSATVAMLGERAPQPRANQSIILEFLVDDVDLQFARLRGALDDIVLEPTTMPWGNRSAIFGDPDGNLVNLFSRPA